MSNTTTLSHPLGETVAAGSNADVRIASAVAFAIGAALVFLVGFSHIGVLHNAAHDTRHGLAFPCH